MIETLKAQLHLALHRQFGRRNEFVDVDQIGLFAGELDSSTVIELSVAAAEEAAEAKADRALALPGAMPAERNKAVRILKDLPREIKVVDIPESDKICSCCVGALHHLGDESSAHMGYCPTTIKIIETRRKKYACDACQGEVKRTALPQTEPLAKSMASASLIAFLVVSKFADGLPLYRIPTRLQRLGIELSHALMSDWLVHCAELLEDLHRRMMAKVLASGHVFTDDTILPLQNDDPARKTTIKARLWVFPEVIDGISHSSPMSSREVGAKMHRSNCSGTSRAMCRRMRSRATTGCSAPSTSGKLLAGFTPGENTWRSPRS